MIPYNYAHYTECHQTVQKVKQTMFVLAISTYADVSACNLFESNVMILTPAADQTQCKHIKNVSFSFISMSYCLV